MKRHISPLLLAMMLFGVQATGAQSVLDVSEASLTPSVIMPESAETNTREMLENWYLKNYAVIDTEADGRGDADFSDEVLLDRLSKLPTVIEMPLNSVVKNSIRFYARKKQLVENMLGLSLYYMPIFEEALERHGLPRELRYLPVIESALVPTAKSRAGAGGLWQFMPSTASGLGLEQNSMVDMRFDPYVSSEAAAIYLKQLYETFGDWSLAIAAYNCGPGNINKALRRAGEGKHDFWEIYPFLPAETRGYVPAFIAANYIMAYHKEHNISPALARRPLVVDTVHVSRRVHFNQISEVMGISMDELRALNPQYRCDIIPGDIKPYSLTLPSLQVYAYVANEDSILNHNANRYTRRGIVEPATSASVGRDARGEYYDEETIQYHTVRRGETLSSIARRYGTTVREIRNLNRCGKRVQAGRSLKIKTVVRRYKEAAPEQTIAQLTDTMDVDTTAVNTIASVDSLGIAATSAVQPDSTITATPDSTAAHRTVSDAFATSTPSAPAQPERPAQTQSAPAAGTSNQQQNRRPRTHKVRRGENLSVIARRYGVSVQALKRANNLTGDAIQAGQRLTIPQ